MVYPPNKIDKEYALECKHSVHAPYQFCLTLKTNLENTTCFLDVVYPPNKIVKEYALECEHSVHIPYQFCLALNS
jgi:hypothetical protein